MISFDNRHYQDFFLDPPLGVINVHAEQFDMIKMRLIKLGSGKIKTSFSNFLVLILVLFIYGRDDSFVEYDVLTILITWCDSLISSMDSMPSGAVNSGAQLLLPGLQNNSVIGRKLLLKTQGYKNKVVQMEKT